MAERILTRAERAQAQLRTGALAHLAAGLMDWVVLVSRYVSRRALSAAARRAATPPGRP